MRYRCLAGLICLSCFCTEATPSAERERPIRKLSYDPAASVVELLSQESRLKLHVRVRPQNEFLSQIIIENLTDEPLTVRLPKAVAAVHTFLKSENEAAPRVRIADPAKEEQESTQGPGQAVVGTFGPMLPSNAFPHDSPEGQAFTIPARRSVQISLHSACAEHGKRPPLSRMTYELKPLDKQVENETLRQVVQDYDPSATDPLAFQAVVWHLANGLSWEALAGKTVSRAGQLHPYFTRLQLIQAQQLIEKTEAQE